VKGTAPCHLPADSGAWRGEPETPKEEPTMMTLFVLVLELVVGRVIRNHNQTRLHG
jgi:hypothetical protein